MSSPQVLYRILVVLTEGPAHGYRIVQEIEQRDSAWTKIFPANLYRRIRTLSARVRRQFGDDMSALFTARLLSARSPLNRVRVWADAVWDLLRHGSAQRFEPPTVNPVAARESRWRGWMSTLGRDLRYAVRVLRTNPLFASVAITTLALGIGANTAMYSVIDAVLLQPLAYPNSERLVAVKTMDIQAGRIGAVTAPANFADQSARSSTFESMAALSGDVVALVSEGRRVGSPACAAPAVCSACSGRHLCSDVC